MDYGGADIGGHLSRYPSVDSVKIPLLKKSSNEDVNKVLKLNRRAKSDHADEWVESQDVSSPYRIAVLDRGRPAAKVQILGPLVTAGQLASLMAYLCLLGQAAFKGPLLENFIPKLFFAGQVSDYRMSPKAV